MTFGVIAKTISGSAEDFHRLDPAGQQAFAADLTTLWSSVNTAPEPANHTLIRNGYLQITATRA